MKINSNYFKKYLKLIITIITCLFTINFPTSSYAAETVTYYVPYGGSLEVSSSVSYYDTGNNRWSEEYVYIKDYYVNTDSTYSVKRINHKRGQYTGSKNSRDFFEYPKIPLRCINRFYSI